jgi:hypothetical protein
MEIEIFEYEHDRANRRYIVRGHAMRGGAQIEVLAAVADSDLTIVNALNNGKTLRATVTEIIRVTLVSEVPK